MQNDAGTQVSDWHKIDTTETRFVLGNDLTKENAAADGPRNGVKSHKKHDISCEHSTPKRDAFASEFPQLAASYGDDLLERVQRALDALHDLEPWQAEKVAASVLGAVDAPLPSFLGGMDDARFWASLATPSEIESYGAACFEAMDPARRPAFFGFVQGGMAA